MTTHLHMNDTSMAQAALKLFDFDQAKFELFKDVYGNESGHYVRFGDGSRVSIDNTRWVEFQWCDPQPDGLDSYQYTKRLREHGPHLERLHFIYPWNRRYN